MALKTKDEILASIETLGIDTTSDAALAFMEDIEDSWPKAGTETVNIDEIKASYETQLSEQKQAYEAKISELDTSWRERYMNRFLSRDGNGLSIADNLGNDSNPPKKLTYEDLLYKGVKK